MTPSRNCTRQPPGPGHAIATCVTAAILALALVGRAAPTDTRSTSEIGLRLQTVLDSAVADDPSIPGVLASVSAPLLGLEWSGASGNSNVRTARKLLPNQPFRIASITKVFVAATIFRLIEDRHLGLFDPVAPYLSGVTITMLRNGGYDPDRITIQQLLAHTSGLYDYAGDNAFISTVFKSPRKHWSRAEQVAFAMNHGQPVARPGERYAYSDTGYVLLGEIIENTTRQSLPLSVRTQLNFSGLGLSSTYFESLEDVPRGSLSVAHQYLGNVDTAVTDPSFDLFGGGGLISTTSDLDRFFRALLTGRVFKRQATLAAALMTVNAQHDANDHLHANLLTTWPFGPRVCWGHRGFWGSESLYCPDADIAVSFSVNQAQTRDPEKLNALASALAKELDTVKLFQVR